MAESPPPGARAPVTRGQVKEPISGRARHSFPASKGSVAGGARPRWFCPAPGSGARVDPHDDRAESRGASKVSKRRSPRRLRRVQGERGWREARAACARRRVCGAGSARAGGAGSGGRAGGVARGVPARSPARRAGGRASERAGERVAVGGPRGRRRGATSGSPAPALRAAKNEPPWAGPAVIGGRAGRSEVLCFLC